MHHALRSSLAIAALIACVGCQTQYRRIYTVRRDKNLHVISPWTPSTTKAAADATSPLGVSTLPPNSDNPSAPGLPNPAPGQ